LSYLLPNPIKKRISGAVVRNLRASFSSAKTEQPKVELDERHLANTRILANRQAMLSRLPSCPVIAEVGVAQGDFSHDILKLAQPRELHLVDAWHTKRYSSSLKQAVATRFASEIEAGRVIIHQGLSTDIGRHLADQYFDFIYIDTDHSYQTTIEELRLFSRKLKQGGILAGHDYTVGSFPTLVMYGVIAAVHQFCVEDDWELKYLTVEQSGYRSFALRKRVS